MATALGEVRIGISGWRYAPWRGVLLPAEACRSARELEFASRMLPTIEINGSFYSLQRPESYAAWHDETPRRLRLRRQGLALHHAHAEAAATCERRSPTSSPRACCACATKLGPILWQFPPQLPLRRRSASTPSSRCCRATPSAALALARRARRAPARAAPGSRSTATGRCATRSRSATRASSTRRFIALLRRHRIALVVADTAGRWPLLEDLTADFVYVRLHGDEELYASGYSDAALDRWAERIDAWRARRAGRRRAPGLAARRRRGAPGATSTATSTTT